MSGDDRCNVSRAIGCQAVLTAWNNMELGIWQERPEVLPDGYRADRVALTPEQKRRRSYSAEFVGVIRSTSRDPGCGGREIASIAVSPIGPAESGDIDAAGGCHENETTDLVRMLQRHRPRVRAACGFWDFELAGFSSHYCADESGYARVAAAINGGREAG